jgi:hypothetical protein
MSMSSPVVASHSQSLQFEGGGGRGERGGETPTFVYLDFSCPPIMEMGIENGWITKEGKYNWWVMKEGTDNGWIMKEETYNM